ncbi:hypothetical protein J6590_022432 [Homalodisca vitripennis]|nr:hypothetical protein J6590_022432 [Homalodisca vitripennis]
MAVAITLLGHSSRRLEMSMLQKEKKKVLELTNDVRLFISYVGNTAGRLIEKKKKYQSMRVIRSPVRLGERSSRPDAPWWHHTVNTTRHTHARRHARTHTRTRNPRRDAGRAEDTGDSRPLGKPWNVLGSLPASLRRDAVLLRLFQSLADASRSLPANTRARVNTGTGGGGDNNFTGVRRPRGLEQRQYHQTSIGQNITISEGQ